MADVIANALGRGKAWFDGATELAIACPPTPSRSALLRRLGIHAAWIRTLDPASHGSAARMRDEARALHEEALALFDREVLTEARRRIDARYLCASSYLHTTPVDGRDVHTFTVGGGDGDQCFVWWERVVGEEAPLRWWVVSKRGPVQTPEAALRRRGRS